MLRDQITGRGREGTRMQTMQVAECSEEISVDEVRECIRRLKSSKALECVGQQLKCLKCLPLARMTSQPAHTNVQQ